MRNVSFGRLEILLWSRLNFTYNLINPTLYPFYMALSRSDKHVDRSAWNKSWEDDFK